MAGIRRKRSWRLNMTAVRLSGSFQRVTQVKPPFSAPSMRTLLVMIRAWFMLNAFLVVAAINDKLQSWVRYLLCTSVVIGLVISGAILMLP